MTVNVLLSRFGEWRWWPELITVALVALAAAAVIHRVK